MSSAALTGLSVGDDPEAWAALGFTVEGGATVVGGVRVELTGDGTGLRHWALDGVHLADDGRLEGLKTSLSPAPATSPAHPNGITEVDHVVVWSPDVDRTIDAFQAAGLELRRERRTGSYGAPMRQAFFRPAGSIIELVGGIEPEGDGPARFFGIAFSSSDMEATAGFLGPRLKAPKPAVQPGRSIATVNPAAGLGVPVVVMSPPPRLDDTETQT